MKWTGRIVGILAIASIVALAWAYFGKPDTSIELPSVSARMLDIPRQLEAFQLEDTKGEPWGLSQLKGRWSIVTFGYTSCPDVCPVAMAYFRDERVALSNPSKVQFVFVSIDPVRDRPKLAEYVNFFDPNIIGVTGDHETLKKLTGMFASAYAVDGENVSHAPHYYIVDPAGQWRGYYQPPLAKGGLASDLNKLITTMEGRG